MHYGMFIMPYHDPAKPLAHYSGHNRHVDYL